MYAIARSPQMDPFGIEIEGTAPGFETRPGIPSLAELQQVVKGYIEAAVNAASKSRPNVLITVYCDEEGKLKRPHGRSRHLRRADGELLIGDLAIAANDTVTGDSIEATEAELLQVYTEELVPLPAVPTPAGEIHG